jgi:hypothetical protein
MPEEPVDSLPDNRYVAYSNQAKKDQEEEKKPSLPLAGGSEPRERRPSEDSDDASDDSDDSVLEDSSSSDDGQGYKSPADELAIGDGDKLTCCVTSRCKYHRIEDMSRRRAHRHQLCNVIRDAARPSDNCSFPSIPSAIGYITERNKLKLFEEGERIKEWYDPGAWGALKLDCKEVFTTKEYCCDLMIFLDKVFEEQRRITADRLAGRETGVSDNAIKLYGPLSQRLELGQLLTVKAWRKFLFEALGSSAGGHPMGAQIQQLRAAMNAAAYRDGGTDVEDFKLVLLKLGQGRILKKQAK